MMAPNNEGIDSVVPVTKRLNMIPQKAIGRAQITTNGSPQLWKFTAISR